MQRIIITDSGLGGLSVVAPLYEKIKNHPLNNPLELIFVNALPETGNGYNKMPNIASKVRVFNEVLSGIENFFSPDLICIACNTLSVIANQTDYYNDNSSKIIGIVERGVESFLELTKFELPYYTIVFGTETTIEMDNHRELMIASGLPEDLIITQVCSGLASSIENDPQSSETKRIIRKSVKETHKKCKKPGLPIYAYLACTHYGYVKPLFEAFIKKEGFTNCKAFDPNQSMVDNIYSLLNLPSAVSSLVESNIQLSIYSRCTILDQEINSIKYLLSESSPETARVLTTYKKIPDLFLHF
jgi:glutamate racemase